MYYKRKQVKPFNIKIMSRKELFSKIFTIITAVHSIEENKYSEWFTIKVSGCVFPDELEKLKEVCYISNISFSVHDMLMEITCCEFDLNL